jgi:CO/xanthine dehydrogenase FAD-binding subunit
MAAVGISARPVRLWEAESAPDAISVAQTAVDHPGDFKGSAEYRREMVAVLLRRALAGLG